MPACPGPGLQTIPASSLPTVVLPRAVRTEIVSAARRCAPHEACGLLSGELAGGVLRVVAAVPFDNLAADPARAFRIDPLSILIAPPPGAGDWIGVYHSHPGAGPEPSAADCEQAWPGVLQVIVGRVTEAAAAWCACVRTEGGTGMIRVPLHPGDEDRPPASRDQNRSV